MSITGKLTSRILRIAALTIGSTTLKPTAAKLAGLLLLLLFASNSLFAQTSYPVQVNVVVTPPNSVYLTDYYTRGSEKLKVQLLLKEVSRPSFPVKIRFRIEGAALRLSSREGVNLPPFTLQGGTMVEASGDALAPYLSLSALVADGADASSFQSKGQRLADGFYKVEVWAEEMGRSVRVSNIATTYISTMLYQSPLVTIPMDKAVLPDQGIQNIVFQWMPRHLGASADAVLATYYKVRLVEVWPSSKDPQEAMRSSKPLYEGLCSSTAFVYGSGQPTLISGRKYALQVQAQDADQRDIFVNQGLSNVVSFTYGEECQIPQGLNVEVKGPNNAIVLWNANAKSSGYTLAYRKVYGTDTSYSEQPLGMPSYSMDNLLPLSSYQVRVAATCGLARSLWSQPRTFTTPGRADTKFECGKNPNIATVTDRTPKTTLAIGETIHAADFDVTIMAAELKNNAYSGGGITRIPFLRNAPAYCTLRDVKVNKDNQLFEGSVILADKLTVISDTMVNNAIRLGKDVVNSLKNKNPNTTVAEIPVPGTISGDPVVTVTNGGAAAGGKTTVTVATSTGQTVAAPAGANTKLADTDGNVVTVSQNGAVTKGKQDKNAFGTGATSSAVAQTSTGGALPLVTFNVDAAKRAYGYDASRPSSAFAGSYETFNGNPVAWMSIETGKGVAVTATFDRQQSKLDESAIRYRTNDGLVVEAKGSKPILLDVRGLYSNTTIPVMAVADTGKVDSLKTTFVCGKINTVGYDREHRRVWLVPVNGCKADAGAISKTLNRVYAQGVVEWEVQHDPAKLSLTLTDAELADLCKEIDVTLLSNYSVGMQAALRKFGKEPEDKTYLLFMVDGKAGTTTGFMPLNRSAGFIYTRGQSADAISRTVAHELGHGAFGLDHVGAAKRDAKLAATDNLMDYNGGTALDKPQWDKLHSEYRRVTWFQGEGDGMSVNKQYVVRLEKSDDKGTVEYLYYPFTPSVDGGRIDVNIPYLNTFEKWNLKMMIGTIKKKDDIQKFSNLTTEFETSISNESYSYNKDNSFLSIDKKPSNSFNVDNHVINSGSDIYLSIVFKPTQVKIQHNKEVDVNKPISEKSCLSNNLKLYGVDDKIYFDLKAEYEDQTLYNGVNSFITKIKFNDEEWVEFKGVKDYMLKKGKNTVSIVPQIGDTIVRNIELFDTAPPLAVRECMITDGSVGFDDFESYKSAPNASRLIQGIADYKVGANNRYTPMFLLTSNSEGKSIPLAFKTTDGKPINGIAKFTFGDKNYYLANKDSILTVEATASVGTYNLTSNGKEVSSVIFLKNREGNPRVITPVILKIGDKSGTELNGWKPSFTNFLTQIGVKIAVSSRLLNVEITNADLNSKRLVNEGITFTLADKIKLLHGEKVFNFNPVACKVLFKDYLGKLIKMKLDSNNYYMVFVPTKPEFGGTEQLIAGYQVPATNIGIILENGSAKAIVHEYGHAIGLCHVLKDLGVCTQSSVDEQGKCESEKCKVWPQIVNIMGYNKFKTSFYLWQKRMITQ